MRNWMACQDRRATFTALCVSVDGYILPWVADWLSAKWDKAYGSVMGWILTRYLLQSFMPPYFYIFGGVTLGATHWVVLMRQVMCILPAEDLKFVITLSSIWKKWPKWDSNPRPLACNTSMPTIWPTQLIILLTLALIIIRSQCNL